MTLERLENGTRPEEIDSSRADVSAADAEMQAIVKELTRIKILRERGAKSSSDLDDAQRAFDVSNAKADAARARYNLVTAPPRSEDVAEAKAQIARLLAQWHLLESGTREDD